MGAKSPDTMNFLIVEDADIMRRSIRAMLKLIHYGKSYYEAPNGLVAWEILSKGELPVDFIISDWNMPYMTGTELLRRVRATPELRDIPFLMLTAEANQEVVAEAAEHEVDGYLTKPFVTASLEQKLQDLLRQVADPGPVIRHLRQALDLEAKGELDSAITEVKKAMALNQQSSRPFRELGRLLMKKGDRRTALTCFQKAVDINRLDVTSYHFLGQIYHGLGKIEKATEFFARAMQISPRHLDRALSYADLLLKQKNLREAEKVLKLVLRNSNDRDLRENIAHICREHGICDLGIRTYRGLLNEDPDRLYLYKHLGLTLLKNGAAAEAVEVMEKATEQHGQDIELLLGLARACLETKHHIRADKWATRVIRIDPGNREAREILDICL